MKDIGEPAPTKSALIALAVAITNYALRVIFCSGLNLKVVVRWKNEFKVVLCQILNY